MPKPAKLGVVVAKPQPRRDHDAHFRCTESEWETMYARMRTLGYTNFSSYARSVLTQGFVPVVREYVPSRRLIYEINKIGVNINQIARHVNTEKRLEFMEIEALIELMQELQALVVAENYGHGIRED